MDFMKSSRFQFKFGGLQIMQISLWIYYRFNLQILLWISLWILWISYKIHLLPYERSGESEDLTRITCVYWFQVDFIWNPPDFTWQISCEIMRHSLPNVLHETEEFFLNYLIYKVFRWISWNPHEICRISWNLPEFMKSAWNPPDFKIMSFWVITKYRSFFRKTIKTWSLMHHTTEYLKELPLRHFCGGRPRNSRRDGWLPCRDRAPM